MPTDKVTEKLTSLIEAEPSETPAQIEARRKEEIRLLAALRVSSARTKIGAVRARDGGEKPRDKHYAWANIHPTRVNHFKTLGYEVCKDPRITTDYEREDGTHVFVDQILMYCDQDYYEALKLDAAIRALEGVEGENIFKSFAERANVKTFEPK